MDDTTTDRLKTLVSDPREAAVFPGCRLAAHVLRTWAPSDIVTAALGAWRRGDAEGVQDTLIAGAARYVRDWDDHPRPLVAEPHRAIVDALLFLASRSPASQMDALALVSSGDALRRIDMDAVALLDALIGQARSGQPIAELVRNAVPIQVRRFVDRASGRQHRRICVRLGTVAGHLTFKGDGCSDRDGAMRLSTALWAVSGTTRITWWMSRTPDAGDPDAALLAEAFMQVEPLMGEDGSLSSRLQAFRQMLDAGVAIPDLVPLVGDRVLGPVVADRNVPDQASLQQTALLVAGYRVLWASLPDGKLLALADLPEGNPVALDESGGRIEVRRAEGTGGESEVGDAPPRWSAVEFASSLGGDGAEMWGDDYVLAQRKLVETRQVDLRLQGALSFDQLVAVLRRKLTVVAVGSDRTVLAADAGGRLCHLEGDGRDRGDVSGLQLVRPVGGDAPASTDGR